jgi:rare lipoprotein A
MSVVAALAACTMVRAPEGGTTVAVAKTPPPLQNPKLAVANGFRVVEEADPTVSAVPDRNILRQLAEIVRGGGREQIGQTYEIAGEIYEPEEDASYDRTGMASWYGGQFHGRTTANGEIFDRTAISAAHPTLPLPSYVRITNLKNDRSIMVRVNDRGPFRGSRLIDVSEQTAALLGFRRHGVTEVRVEYVSRAPLEGEDKATLLATYNGPPPDQARVRLAAAEPARPVTANAVAFVPERPPKRIADPMQSLTVSLPAAERILIAFEAAETAE